MKLKLKSIISDLKSFRPQPLPQTGLALNAMIEEILQRANVPSNDSFRHAMAGEFMQPENISKDRSIQYYVRILKQRVCSQLAYGIIDDIRTKEKAARAEQQTEEASGQVV